MASQSTQALPSRSVCLDLISQSLFFHLTILYFILFFLISHLQFSWTLEKLRKLTTKRSFLKRRDNGLGVSLNNHFGSHASKLLPSYPNHEECPKAQQQKAIQIPRFTPKPTIQLPTGYSYTNVTYFEICITKYILVSIIYFF